MIQSCSKIICIAIFVTLLSGRMPAQLDSPTDGPGRTFVATPVPGSGHEYIQMLSETVDPANGSLNVQIDLPIPTGRQLTLPFGFIYHSAATHYLVARGSNTDVANYTSGGWSYAVPQIGKYDLTSYYQYAENVWFPCPYTTGWEFRDSAGGHHSFGFQTGLGCTGSGPPYGGSGSSDRYKATFNSGGDGKVVDLSGTTYSFSAPYVGNSEVDPNFWIVNSVEDRNGNKITVSHDNGLSISDTLGRVVLSASGFGHTGDTVTVAGQSSSYTLGWTTATANYNAGPTGTCPNGLLTPFNTSQGVISSITLPNGKQYQFEYEAVFGLLKKITYPTGATVTYIWQLNAQSEAGQFQYEVAYPNDHWDPCNAKYGVPAISSRTVSFDGVKPAFEQDFTYSTSWSSNPYAWDTKHTTIVNHDLIGNTTTQTQYIYMQSTAPYPASLGGIPVENTVQYQDAAGTTLRTVTKEWYDPELLKSQQITLENGQTSKQSFSYISDPSGPGCTPTLPCFFGLPVEVDEYDFGTGAPGSLLRKTITNYASFPATVIYPDAPSILNRPSSVIVYDGSNTVVAETDYSYDQNSVASATATSHDDTNYGTGNNNRGNVTTVTRKCFPHCTDAVTTYKYDVTGQVISTVDPNGNAAGADASKHTTSYDYSDDPAQPSNTNAYVTKITYPKTNGVDHIEHFSYNYVDGHLTVSKDQNGKSTTYTYADALGRLTKIDYPDTGQIVLGYNDNPPLTVTKTVSASPNPNVVTSTVYDGMGRVHKTILNSSSEGALYTRTDYDGLGRVLKVWNPTRCDPDTSPNSCTGETTWGTTQYAYDALERLITVTHPDGTVASTEYVGRSAKVADEGNGSVQIQRISQSDALGRMTAVCEISSTTQAGNSNNAPANCQLDKPGSGFLTSYQYDTLGNLTKVSQAGLSDRTSTYNSLSQLVCAGNPEVSNGTCPPSDSGTYTNGTIRYTYDLNGNIKTKIAPKPNQTSNSVTVTATYTYDEINRLTKKECPDLTIGSGTSTVNIDFDTSSELGVSGLTNTVGRKSGEYVTDGNNQKLAGSVFGYDEIGRIKTNSQCTPQNCPSTAVFGLTYTYDLSGKPRNAVNADLNATVTYGFNDAGHLTSVTSTLADSNHPGTFLSNVSYGPLGLTHATLGNGLIENRAYHPRGWLQSKQESVSAGLPSKGTVIIGGSLHYSWQQLQPGTTAGESVSINGSMQYLGNDGGQQDCAPDAPWCHDVYDSGWLTICIYGYGYCKDVGYPDLPYDEWPWGNNSYHIAADFASAFSNDPNSPVSATATSPDGGVTWQVNLTSHATGSGANYSVYAVSNTIYSNPSGQFYVSSPSFWPTPSGWSSMSGGQDPQYGWVPDPGSTTITVNDHPTTYYWSGSSTTATSVAQGLCNTINGDGAYVYAATNSAAASVTDPTSSVVRDCSVASTTIYLTARNVGPNYSLSASSSPNFSVSCPGFADCTPATNAHLTGGANPSSAIYSFNITTFAPNGDIRAANDQVNGNWSYTYDDLNRLKTAVSSNGSGCTENYDRYGNRWTQDPYSGSCNAPHYTFTGANNRIDGFGYDAAGNVTNDGLHSYTYDAENRIVKVDGGSTATYVYDGEGQRVRRVTGSGIVDYLYDLNGHVVTEVNTSGVWTRGEVYAPGRHLATYSDGTAGTTYFPHTDWLGTERLRTQVNGAEYTPSRWTSLPFGEGSSAPNPSPLHFTGKERDSESGLDFFGARFYESVMGRFLSPDWSEGADPVPYANPRNPQTLNLYTYVSNNPVTARDLFGHVQICGPTTYSTDKDGNTVVNANCHDVNDLFLSRLMMNSSCNNRCHPEPFRPSGSNPALTEIAWWLKALNRADPAGFGGFVAGFTIEEQAIAAALRAEGFAVRSLEVVEGEKSADAIVNGITTEFKTLRGTGLNSLKNQIEEALEQAPNVVVDARNVPSVTKQYAVEQIERVEGNAGSLKGRVIILTRQGPLQY